MKLISKNFIKNKNSLFNIFNISKEIMNFFIGDVLRIYYFLVFKNKRRIFTFFGMLISKNFKKLNYVISNNFNGQMLKITFSMSSPYVVALSKSYKYLHNIKKNKVYYKKKLRLNFIFENDPFNNYLQSTSNDIYHFKLFKLVWPLGLPYVKTKKIRKKFRI